ncbi:hypothetical protein BBN02_23010 [Vibrio parahaemolyticus]|uniref:hypothetical protein n=1 Tax=Vibrio parahaemolyticus TaxID=670 RepID=UPI00084A6246|nr:hypothetical protein [Vibrio parahaemolyticus]ODZ29879.1 hypothetical protein BBN02_23010 [Vibrio parahaemolyticus]
MKLVAKECKALNKSSFELFRRRLNWRVCAKPRIFFECEKYAEKANGSGYPFRLFCVQGSKDENYETIQLSAGVNPVGVVKKKTEVTEDGKVNKSRSTVCESGASLVFSQAVNGAISIMMYPYKSDLHSRTEKNIILYHSLHPDDITSALIKKCIKNFLMYARLTSVLGLECKPSIYESSKITWFAIKDIRFKSELFKSILNMSNEWGKIIVPIMLGYIIAVLSKT